MPTDYSNCSGEAIRWAVSLAEPLSAGLLLLHVVSRDVAEEQLSIPGMSWDLLEAREERALRELYRLWVTEEEGASLLRGTLVAIGDPAEKIVTAAEKACGSDRHPSYGHRSSTRSAVNGSAPLPVRF
jgi:nucleotide-binding universal stress UspA family protein